ncbi:patatin-like phospholipase family protein [Comamonas endophytica]|uniref:Patatin-like phospholipase family protein n=1 Tax=Comamonas endophytica TaxID=2949090 RepID=A0ABY6G5U2_9BURK|nr:patatin-like phospholipase family protein [Acidovorax sp. 5MLIR]UYG50386.1 patatin-like phospholipase family protein [Acidovorax sp. 5MLIR]
MPAPPTRQPAAEAGFRRPAAPATRTLNTAQLINQQEELQASLSAEMAAAAAHWETDARQAFAARAATMVNDVVSDCMYPVHSAMIDSPGHTVRREAFEAAAALARRQVERHQQVALSLEPMRDPVPTVQRLDSGRILLLRPAPAIENLVLSGGGAKGMANAPALRALDNLGLLSQLKQVVGSSVGAMTAVLMASGMSAKRFQRLLNGSKMLSMLGTPEDFARLYPQVKFACPGFAGGALVQMLDRQTGETVARHLREHWAQLVREPAWAQCTAQEQQRLGQLCAPDFSQPRSTQMVTFGDLHLLHRMAPQHFKELVVTGWNREERRVGYFSHRTHPDLPVALAGRISASVPVLFADVILQGQHWTDGGVGSLIPAEAVLGRLSGQALAETQARTLLMTFADHGRADKVMHAPPQPHFLPAAWLLAILSGNPQFAKHNGEDLLKVRAAGLMAMPVRHGDLGIGSFHASAQRIDRAKREALKQALAHIELSRHNYRHDLVDDVQAAAALLSPAEQALFLARHANDATPLHAQLRAAIGALQGQPAPAQEAAQRAAALDWARRDPVCQAPAAPMPGTLRA